jgi:hypothetical protein
MYVPVSSLRCLGFEANSRIWQRTQAIVGLPLNRGEDECLPNNECSVPSGVTVFLSLTAPHGQAAGVADEPKGNLRCIMGIGLNTEGVIGASQGAIACQQGQEKRPAVERIPSYDLIERTTSIITAI